MILVICVNILLQLEPFARLKKSPTSLYGNDIYEGFAIDLIRELSLVEGFDYTFANQADKVNGDCEVKNNTKTCTGMVAEIVEGVCFIIRLKFFK